MQDLWRQHVFSADLSGKISVCLHHPIAPRLLQV